MCEHGLRANGRWASVWDDRMSAGAFMWRARNLAGAATSLRELTTEAVSARTAHTVWSAKAPSPIQQATCCGRVVVVAGSRVGARTQLTGRRGRTEHWYRLHT